MSEEATLNNEPIINVSENTATDASTSSIADNADVSNSATYKSEPPTSPDAGPKVDEVPPAAEKTDKKATSHRKSDSDEDLSGGEATSKKRFHFKKDDKEFLRDKWILSRISDDQLMDYLTLEQRRNELQQQAKDIKEKRILKAFQLTAALATIVGVIYLLRDNPTILVNILYIAGMLTAFWFYKNPRDK